jgi:SAM-dependent methyltransferase
VRGKRYDRAYFDRWYRHPRTRMWTPAAVARKVRMVVALTEQLLGRPIRSVLDVGCGEGAWQPILARLRPGVRYVGVDSSAYAVARYGRRRHLRLGTFGNLKALRLRGRFDLVVCCDVLHYLPDAEVASGLRALRALARGPAYLEAYAAEDAVEGDDRGFHRRPATRYRALFHRAGFVPCGMHCYVTAEAAQDLTALERAALGASSAPRGTGSR